MDNTEQTNPQVGEDAAKQPELGLGDLQNLRTLLELSIRRGTFAANEISSVGAVYDRLNAFLSAVMPPPAAEQAPADNSEPTISNTEAN